jgi:2-C-methyl-D-erythritol 4-phosphate cytidylyltransferase
LSEAQSLPVWAVVVAAGSGERLGADRPKAYVRFAGRTLLAASLEVLEEHPAVDGIVVVVPEGWEERTSLLADDLCAGKIAAAVAGGATRAESVREGLEALPDSAAFVLVHDAARPLVSPDLVDRVLRGLAGGADGVVPALPLTDTVKRVDGERVLETVDRSALVAVQTPQGFPVARLREAIERAGGDLGAATDCASLVERAGGRVVHVEGDPENLKVTTKDDLRRAERLLADRPAR